ncbi:homeobox transcription [Phlyctema vagabunda]|uniref:Homeobox transcription n=1 Tax=Phlyctema vagabunda TaxID=108571 RepID=A0ABR4PXP1_9HELO
MDHHYLHAAQYEQHFPHHPNLQHHPSNQLSFESQHSHLYDRQSPMITMPNVQKNETKPRLGKEEVEILEREFQKNPKPTTNTKKQFAEQMSVDLSRINNWFQNRRAKRKQEKKQEAYEAGQAREALGYSESDSPEYFGTNSFYDSNGMLPIQANQTLYPLLTGPPPAIASYNPQYSDPTGASIESLERTMAAAHAAAAAHRISAQEFHEGYVQQNDGLPNFGGPLVLRSGPNGDRAPFPAPTAPRYNNENLFQEDPSLLHFEDSVQSLNDATETPTMFNGYTVPSDLISVSPQAMTNFGSHLLPSAESLSPSGSDNMESLEYQNDASEHSSTSQSPPAPGQFRSPPPPSDIAKRRNVAHKPAALGMEVIRNRPQLGPRTVSQADSYRRPMASPGASPMCRTFSGNSVITGRVMKPGARPPQRSPIDMKFFSDTMERNYHTSNLPPSLTTGSSLNCSLAPPTPMSPMEHGMRGSTTESSSPESSLNFMVGGSSQGFFGTDGESNMASPPDTPGPNAWYLPGNDWKYGMSDEPIYTPANDEFPAHFTLETQTPAYLASVSQPVTPAFGGDFNHNLLLQNNSSPQYLVNSCGQPEYSFSEGLPSLGFLPGSSPQSKSKTFQFSNSTPADFTEK